MRGMKSRIFWGTLMLLVGIPAMASDRAALTQIVYKAPAKQMISTTPVTLNVGSPIQLSSTISGVQRGAIPTGTVVFSLTVPGTTGTAVSSGPLTIQPDGTVNWTTTDAPVGHFIVSSAYSGDSKYQPNNTAAQDQIEVLGAADFSLQLPKTMTIKQGATGSLNLSVSAINNFHGDVQLSCSGLGIGMSCNFSPISLKVGGTIPAVPVSSAFSVSSTATTVETLSGLLIVLGFLPMRNKRRTRRALFAVCLTVICLGSVCLSGCGGSMRYQQRNGTPLGKYNVVITGTSGKLTHSETIVVTVN